MNSARIKLDEFRPRRWLVHGALAFGVGVFLGLYAPFHFLWPLGAALAAGYALALRRLGKSPYVACLFLALLLGLTRCSLAAHPALPAEGSYAITARVTGEPQVRETDGRVAVFLRNVRLPGEAGSFCAYWTYWPKEPEQPLPLDGQTVSFAGRVYHPMAQRNPHGFDFRLYLLQKGVQLGVSGGEDIVLSPAEQSAPRSLLLRLRQGVRARLRLLLGEDCALALALLLNDKTDLPEEMAAGFREAGVAHVLAVSGLHVMILFACVTLLLRRFSPSQALVTVVGAVLLGAYALLAGAQAPVLRAAILMLYVQFGHVLRRRADRLIALATAFSLILLVHPLELFAAGFQMSFGAVLGMTLLGDRMGHLLRRVRGRRGKVLRAYALTLCASIGTALPVSWYYHRVSLLGLAVNPLMIAAVTGLLPLLIALVAVSLVWLPAGLFLGKGAALLCRLITRAVQALATLPLTSVAVPRLPLWAMAAIVCALILCTRYVLLRPRVRVAFCGGLLALTAALLLLTQSRDVRYIQLSVNSADAAIIEDGRQTIVIDTADYGGSVSDYLLSTGRRADVLILSHLHTDHALGLNELLKNGVPIGMICLSTEALVTPVSASCLTVLERAQAAGIPVRTLSAGDRLGTGRVTVDVLWPEKGGANPKADANDFALALRIDLDGVTLLQMSDVTGAYEGYSAQPANILKVAHHGSAASTAARFLQRVQPEIALLSTRRASDAVLERLAEAGVMVYDTSERGALTLTVHGGEARIQGYLR